MASARVKRDLAPVEKDEGTSILSAQPKRIQGNSQMVDVAWDRTHLVIINGDDDPGLRERHMDNVELAAKAGLENNAAGVYVAGFTRKKLKGVERFEGKMNKPGTPKEEKISGIGEMLEMVGENTKKGDTVFLYVTGHGADDHFIIEGLGELKHNKLKQMLEKLLPGREIIFVSDACKSANFVKKFMRSEGKFTKITAMSPGIKDENTSCSYFSKPFWDGVKNGIDLDGNGIATLEESFYYGLGKYRQLRPDTLGTYRETIPTVKSLKEVKEGIVLVTAEWCDACKLMRPVFNRANLLLKGTLPFYEIEQEDAKVEGPIPILLIVKDGEVVAKKVGRMELPKLADWMDDNGIEMHGFELSMEELYKKGMHDAILQVFPYEEIVDEFGIDESIELFAKQVGGQDPEIKKIALQFIRMAGEKEKLSDYPEVLEALTDAVKDEDEEVQGRAGSILDHISKETDLTEHWGLVVALAEGAPDYYGESILGDLAEKHPGLIIPFLQKLMVSKNPKERGVAAGALCRARDVAMVYDQARSIKRGGEAHDSLATLKLWINGLEDKEPKVRGSSMRALGILAAETNLLGEIPELLGTFTSLLSDEDKGVRKKAVMVFNLLASVKVLVERYPELSRKHPELPGKIADLIADEDEKVESWAADTVLRMSEYIDFTKYPQTIGNLAENIFEPTLRKSVLVDARTGKPLGDPNERILAMLLEKSPKKIVAQLKELLKTEDVHKRAASAYTLAFLVKQKGITEPVNLKKVVDVLVECMGEAPEETRWLVGNGLSLMLDKFTIDGVKWKGNWKDLPEYTMKKIRGNPAAMAGMAKVIRDGKATGFEAIYGVNTANILKDAVEGLKISSYPEAFDIILEYEIVKGNMSPILFPPGSIVETAIAHDPRAAIKELYLLLTNRNYAIRGRAREALGRGAIRSGEVALYLAGLAKDNNVMARLAAIYALGETSGGFLTMPAVVKVYTDALKDRSIGVRAAAASAVRKFSKEVDLTGYPKLIEALEKLANNPKENVQSRKAAERALRRIGK